MKLIKIKFKNNIFIKLIKNYYNNKKYIFFKELIYNFYKKNKKIEKIQFFLNKTKKNIKIIFPKFNFFFKKNLFFFSSFLFSKKIEIFNNFTKNKKSIYFIVFKNLKFKFKKYKNKENKKNFKIILYIKKKYYNFLDFNFLKQKFIKFFKFFPIPIFLNNILINNKEFFPNFSNNKKKILKFYKKNFFYRLEKPIFWVNLKSKKFFNIKGILFFPKINKITDIKNNKIFFYKEKIFITNKLNFNFLNLLEGIINFKNIKFNFYLNNKIKKKIQKYIIKKICKKIIFLIKKKEINKKWKYIENFVIYGILTNKFFLKKYKSLLFFKNFDKKFFTLKKLIKKIKKKKKQISKKKKIIIFYFRNYKKEYNYIQKVKKKGFKYIINLKTSFFLNLIEKLETINNKLYFINVKSDFSNIFQTKKKKRINKKIKRKILKIFKKNKKFIIKIKKYKKKKEPFLITINEFFNRLKFIKNFHYNVNKKNFPIKKKYILIINIKNKIIKKILNKKKKFFLILNLYLIIYNLLKGKKLKKFIKKKIIKKIL
ncbi:MAG: hypothetical protein NHG09_00015 [Candidatus Shikimatogenerans sp. JK-2022]|nr:hypothetical protein [Candidatus Shikimatogenerans bostrichidophilus]